MSSIEKALRRNEGAVVDDDERLVPAEDESVAVDTPPPAPEPEPEPRPTSGRYHALDKERLTAAGIALPGSPRSRLTEEFRLIKRPLLNHAFGPYRAQQQAPNLVMVTSAGEGEGKTFCTLNLAMSISREVDRTVLLVDADVARPGFPECTGLPSEPGLLDLLTDSGLAVPDVIVRTDYPNISVIPAGTAHGRSTELLGSEPMAALAAEMAHRYPDRIVLFDSPPLLSASEGSVLAEHMGQIVLVAEAEHTPQAALNQALSLLDGCENVVTVLNKAAMGRGDGAGYGYGYGD